MNSGVLKGYPDQAFPGEVVGSDSNGNIKALPLPTHNHTTLTNTTLNSPTLSTPTISGAAISGATVTTSTLTSPTITTPVITQGTVAPTFTSNVHTLALTSAGQLLLASNGATAGTINIPTNTSVAFTVGTQIHIIQTGAGQITITATTPATTTIFSTGATLSSPKMRAQHSTATLLKTATDTWYVFGDIA